MVVVTERQQGVLKLIEANEGISIKELLQLVYNSQSSLSGIMTNLVNKGLIRKAGSKRECRYYPTGVDYSVKSDITPRGVLNDELLNNLSNIEMTEEKLKDLHANLHLPRRQLAALLGISKLVLNQYMDKHEITSKKGCVSIETLA
ncbi:helix-turn-helix domain-containing protein [Paenibacillus sp. L3-i20]|uniref:MarR family transcriptional regulator n=1 Tax=Paenibacillus sp. L3-i20 TaxID=2905833 RepID=UPI001EE09957|nr:helix-turn-helix domain-containing protein [Paenibacillus sp. L3-i20]GKU79798.1 hypothetical protein L3i20_v241950 [Paenibacillus sp. L3-i20]